MALFSYELLFLKILTRIKTKNGYMRIFGFAAGMLKAISQNDKKRNEINKNNIENTASIELSFMPNSKSELDLSFKKTNNSFNQFDLSFNKIIKR